MFQLDRFIEDARAALAEGGQPALRALTARAVADPGAVLAGLGEPAGGGLVALHRSAELTILNVVWAPRMTIMPHNHAMWAVIGVYTGGEDNIFWRRLPEGKVEAAGAKSLRAGDCTALGQDIIHSATNPLGRLTEAIHVYGGDFFVYGGDFFAAERSEWEPDSLEERPYDLEKARRMFGAG